MQMDVVVVNGVDNCYHHSDFHLIYQDACLVTLDSILGRRASSSKSNAASNTDSWGNWCSSTSSAYHYEHVKENTIWISFYNDGYACSNIHAFIGNNNHVTFISDNKIDSIVCNRQPSQLDLQHMNLKLGCNKMTCICNTADQWLQQRIISFDIWLYDVNDKLIVMDIDGTITKSDLQGYIETVLLGIYNNHIHDGIYTFLDVMKNHHNLHVLYLTARPIADVHVTKQLLGYSDGSKRLLPDGPLFMVKENKVKAVMNELCKKTFLYKSTVLSYITKLFTSANSNTAMSPLVIGIGNRPHDAHAYIEAGIPEDTVFIIDTQSTIQVWRDHYTKSNSSVTTSLYASNTNSITTFDTYSDHELFAYIEKSMQEHAVV